MPKKRVLVCLILLLTLLSAPSLPAQDQEAKELLSGMGITPYPGKSDLENGPFDPQWMKGDPLLEEDINQDFSNIGDLAWLERVARENKVVLFGEWHYYQTIYHLKNRVLFALNTYDYFPLVIVEHQYSITGFLDYYIGLKSDLEARAFYRDVIYDLVGEKEKFDFLEHLRRWNKTHPDKRIHFGASDIEHDYMSTLRRVIEPYFKKLDRDFSIDFDNFAFLDLETLIPELKTLLKQARAVNLQGEYPFITPQYIENVLENLESLFMGYRYEFDYYRQRAIVRNLTDPRFFGHYFREGKVMIYGGGFHTPTHFPYPAGGNFYREGSYLTFDFEPTKGKTYSIMVRGMAYQFGSMADVDLKNALHHGSGYRNNVQTFQGAYKQKLVSPEGYYLLQRELDDLTKFYLSAAYAYDHRPLLIRKMDWQNILTKAREKSKNLFGSARWAKDDYDHYDAYIYVFRSPITHVLPKRSK